MTVGPQLPTLPYPLTMTRITGHRGRRMGSDDPAAGGRQWTFLTNHAHVLLCIARDPGVRLRDVAIAVGITERSTQRIIADLEEAGYLSRERVGRRNRYQVHPELPFRHPVEQRNDVGTLLRLLSGNGNR